jgi:acetyltransferase-like isoleucine patch superfamily enzyme
MNVKILVKYFFRAIVFITALIVGVLVNWKIFGLLNYFYYSVKSKIYSYRFQFFGNGTLIRSFDSLISPENISIGENTVLGYRTVLTAWKVYNKNTYDPKIIIGGNVSIGNDCHITAINKIVISDFVLLGSKITITDNSHGEFSETGIQIPPILRDLKSKGPVIIGHSVWIGDKATILPGVTIGANSIVAANSVVRHCVPSNVIVAGSPAVIVKSLK